MVGFDDYAVNMTDKLFILPQRDQRSNLVIAQLRHFEVGQHVRNSSRHYDDVNTCFLRVAVIDLGASDSALMLTLCALQMLVLLLLLLLLAATTFAHEYFQTRTIIC